MKIFWKIIKESFNIIIATSIISSVGGIGLESIREKLVLLIPILILIPAMNDMMGDFGSVISSKFVTLLYMGKTREKEWWRSHILGDLFITIAIVAVMSAIYISLLACTMSLFKGFRPDAFFVVKMLLVSIITVVFLIVFMFWLSATVGFYVFKKSKDPSNFLIPITTAVADLGSMLLITIMVVWFF